MNMKSALRKGLRETVNVFKHDLVVDIRVRVSYAKKKYEVRKKVISCLGGGLDFIRETAFVSNSYAFNDG